MSEAQQPTREDREQLAAIGIEQARWAASRFHKLPAGLDRQELESVGNEAVMEAIVTWDPANGDFRGYARLVARSRMQDAIRAARSRARGRVPFQPTLADGSTAQPPVDTRADDPAEVAMARDELEDARAAVAVVRPRETRLKVSELQSVLPAPDVVADRVAELREAMFGAINTSDVTAAMDALKQKAAAGDLRAIKLLIDMLAPKAAPTATANAAVFVNNDRG